MTELALNNQTPPNTDNDALRIKAESVVAPPFLEDPNFVEKLENYFESLKKFFTIAEQIIFPPSSMINEDVKLEELKLVMEKIFSVDEYFQGLLTRLDDKVSPQMQEFINDIYQFIEDKSTFFMREIETTYQKIHGKSYISEYVETIINNHSRSGQLINPQESLIQRIIKNIRSNISRH